MFGYNQYRIFEASWLHGTPLPAASGTHPASLPTPFGPEGYPTGALLAITVAVDQRLDTFNVKKVFDGRQMTRYPDTQSFIVDLLPRLGEPDAQLATVPSGARSLPFSSATAFRLICPDSQQPMLGHLFGLETSDAQDLVDAFDGDALRFEDFATEVFERAGAERIVVTGQRRGGIAVSCVRSAEREPVRFDQWLGVE